MHEWLPHTHAQTHTQTERGTCNRWSPSVIMQICALMQLPESRVIGCHVSWEELIYLDEPSLLICFAELPKMSDFKAAAQSETPGLSTPFFVLSLPDLRTSSSPVRNCTDCTILWKWLSRIFHNSNPSARVCDFVDVLLLLFIHFHALREF